MYIFGQNSLKTAGMNSTCMSRRLCLAIFFCRAIKHITSFSIFKRKKLLIASQVSRLNETVRKIKEKRRIKCRRSASLGDADPLVKIPFHVSFSIFFNEMLDTDH